MKTSTLKILALTLITVSMIQACKNPGGEKSQATDAREVQKSQDKALTVNTEQSSVKWLGTKPTGEHHGFVPIIEGKINQHKKNITGGKFTFDIANLSVEDLEDPKENQKLTDHLNSPDFFNTDTFPTITFDITEVKENDSDKFKDGLKLTHEISGNLTIKDISKNISFNANILFDNDKIELIAPQFLIDRTKWNVNYGSKSVFDDLKDNFIHDDIGITLKIVTE
ncbi:MAG: YceI family protein [Bacteroidales bacterium]